jgi:5'-nucleotidase
MSFEGPLDMNASYRVTVADFLANGGDTFFTFTKGTNRTTGPVDLAALEAWLAPARPAPCPRTIATRICARSEPGAGPNTSRTPPPGMHY